MEKKDVIADLMKSAPMTGKKMAELIDTEYSYVMKVLKGEKPMTDEMLIKFCAALGVSTIFEPIEVPLVGEMVLKNGTNQMWDEKGKWLGDYFQKSTGERTPLFRRNPEVSKEQNNHDAKIFKAKYPAHSLDRVPYRIDLRELKINIPGVYRADILDSKAAQST